MTDERPQHPWNDPDNDGHNCIDCHNESIWKCDRYAHPGESVLPPLTEIEGLPRIDSLEEIIPEDDRKKLSEELAEMARQRRAMNPEGLWLA